ncbi:MAG: hypothetical protein JWL84_2642 [Rhodospirillales bacterium]|nr:hypothetical protein [Rhodospirillales bacterium]
MMWYKSAELTGSNCYAISTIYAPVLKYFSPEVQRKTAKREELCRSVWCAEYTGSGRNPWETWAILPKLSRENRTAE